FHHPLHELQRLPLTSRALTLGTFEIEKKIQVGYAASRWHRYDVNICYCQFLRSKTVIQRLDGQTTIVLGPLKALLGDVGHNLPISDQRRAAVVANVDAQDIHRKTSMGQVVPAD